MARARKLDIEQQRLFYNMCEYLMCDKESDEILDLVDAFANCALDCIAASKGITDIRMFPEIATQISHSAENEMRDYIEYYTDLEYGRMRKKGGFNESMG